MNLEPVITLLEDAGLGVAGETLFIQSFPAEVSEGIMLRPRLTGVKLDYDLPGYLKFDFQLVTRGRNHAATQALAVSAAHTLTIKARTTVGPWTVNYIRPSTIPVGYPISVGEMVEYNTNISACIVDPEWQ